MTTHTERLARLPEAELPTATTPAPPRSLAELRADQRAAWEAAEAAAEAAAASSAADIPTPKRGPDRH